MRIPLVAGRHFDRRDRTGTTPVAMVNHEFAARDLGGHAVGKRVSDSGNRVMEIIGVVKADARIAVKTRRVRLSITRSTQTAAG